MVVGYCRISRDEDNESYASIESQTDLINKFALSNNLFVEKIFVDDNFSGYTVTKYDDTLFDRPAFIEMMNLVKQGSIDTILTKDESRIGRRQSVVLLTFERLKRMNCRCLEVHTGHEIYNNTTGVTSWSNEQFIIQTSEKVRRVLHSKQENGSLIMGNHYGYIKKDKTSLEADRDIEPCIKLIYDLYLKGFGYAKIARYLNENTNFPTPSEYYNRVHRARGRIYGLKVNPVWEPYHITRILSDDIYCGTLTTHKKEVIGIKGRAIRLPEEKHIKFPCHHEAIIPQANFDLVQQIRKERSKQNYRGSRYNYIFKGLCVCTECNHHVGGLMLRRAKDKAAYNCTQYVRYGKRGCSNKIISEHDLLCSLRAFLNDTRYYYEGYLSGLDYKSKAKNFNILLNKARQDKTKAEEEYRSFIQLKNLEFSKCGPEYASIKIAQYNYIENQLLNNIDRSRRMINNLEKNIDGFDHKLRSYMSAMEQFINSNHPARNILAQLIDIIYFHKDKSIEFKLKIEIPK